jgi:hydrophobic/amphiphilic exporter-1 (mainly G- bacteria), HAE1 family
MSRFAIRYPYLIIVLCLMTCVVGVTSLVRMPVDLFPPIKIPVIVVATFYSGMPPEQIENDITGQFERTFTLASGIDHMESRSLTGVSLIKVYFQPGSDPQSDAAAVANLALATLRYLPPGTLPPIVMPFDASSLPVCLVTLKGEGLTEAQLRDQGQFNLRNQLAGVPGASLPPAFGGKYRQIMVYVDPNKLEAHGLSVMDVVQKVNEANLILPSGDIKIGPYDYNVYANGQINAMKDINLVPLKTEGEASVLVADVGKATDSSQIQVNKVRVNGQASVYLPVLKLGGDANTIEVVDGIKQGISHLVNVPKQLVPQVVFDQSVFVMAAIENLIHEGAIGLLLTGIMILVFLGSPRATVAVFLSIPLSALAAFIALAVGGSSVNAMILGGLALAFSRLIDNSVVVLENVFRHLEMGEPPEVAAERGGEEVALPVLAATLTLVVVLFPVFLLYGVSKYLFSALGLSLVLSLFASYFVAMTVVPLFCANLIKKLGADHALGEAHATPLPHRPWDARFNSWFNRKFAGLLNAYDATLSFALLRPVITILVISGLFLLSLFLYPMIGKSYFPRTDPSQFVINVKAPSGTRIELTDELVGQVEKIVREVVPTNELKIIVSNIGIQPGFSSILTPNSAPHTAFVEVGLNEGHKLNSFEYMDLVRARMERELPQVSAYFQTGGLVDAIVNQGMPAPLDIQISSQDMNSAHAVATQIARQTRLLPGVGDVLVPQDVDYPSLKVEVDRERASELGLSTRDVVDSLITSLTSDVMIAPSYWIDETSGNPYFLAVQYPENLVRNIEDLGSMPLRSPNLHGPAGLESVSHGQADSAQRNIQRPRASGATRLDSVVKISHILTPTEVDHYQIQRIVDVYVAPKGEDLSRIYAGVTKIIGQTHLPENMKIAVRGSVQSMRESFHSFAIGIVLSVILVYLILVAQFKSFLDPFLILLAVPPGLTGVLLILYLTNTPISVMALMGMILVVGISVSDSILIVEFINRLRAEGKSLREAVALGPRVRLRPVLMTTLATLIGLIPMAMKMGAGGEAYTPLARAVIGGLAISAAQTVFLVPCAYLLIHGILHARRSAAPKENSVA